MRFVAVPDPEDSPWTAIMVYDPSEVVYAGEATPSVEAWLVEWVPAEGAIIPSDAEAPETEGYSTYLPLSRVEAIPSVEVEAESLDEAVEAFLWSGGWSSHEPQPTLP